jgi:dihydrolipoamide dehydrogenase
VAEHVKLTVPDLGEFADVEVIEILVKPGDDVAVEDGLVTLETDKASIDVPASQAGKVISVDVKVGDTVSTGDAVVTVEVVDHEATLVMTDDEIKAITSEAVPAASATASTSESASTSEVASHSAHVVVIGSGPGGYTAAFRAADLGLDVILVERYPDIGGVCLNVGCIPSKALLHAAKVIDEAEAMAEHGVRFGKPKIDALALRGWKNSVVKRLTGGLTQLAKQRKVRILHGVAKFESANRLRLDTGHTIEFGNCIIAAGSQSAMLPGLPDDPRIIDSTGALELAPLPKRLLVVGGGIIGLDRKSVV